MGYVFSCRVRDSILNTAFVLQLKLAAGPRVTRGGRRAWEFDSGPWFAALRLLKAGGFRVLGFMAIGLKV